MFRKGDPNPGFVKGQSGNPSGRPRGLETRMRTLLGDKGVEDIYKFLKKVLASSKERTVDRLKAADMLLDRSYGKARANVDLKIDDGPAPKRPITEWSKIPIERRREILTTLDELDALQGADDGRGPTEH